MSRQTAPFADRLSPGISSLVLPLLGFDLTQQPAEHRGGTGERATSQHKERALGDGPHDPASRQHGSRAASPSKTSEGWGQWYAGVCIRLMYGWIGA